MSHCTFSSSLTKAALTDSTEIVRYGLSFSLSIGFDKSDVHPKFSLTARNACSYLSIHRTSWTPLAPQKKVCSDLPLVTQNELMGHYVSEAHDLLVLPKRTCLQKHIEFFKLSFYPVLIYHNAQKIFWPDRKGRLHTIELHLVFL